MWTDPLLECLLYLAAVQLLGLLPSEIALLMLALAPVVIWGDLVQDRLVPADPRDYD